MIVLSDVLDYLPFSLLITWEINQQLSANISGTIIIQINVTINNEMLHLCVFVAPLNKLRGRTEESRQCMKCENVKNQRTKHDIDNLLDDPLI